MKSDVSLQRIALAVHRVEEEAEKQKREIQRAFCWLLGGEECRTVYPGVAVTGILGRLDALEKRLDDEMAVAKAPDYLEPKESACFTCQACEGEFSGVPGVAVHAALLCNNDRQDWKFCTPRCLERFLWRQSLDNNLRPCLPKAKYGHGDGEYGEAHYPPEHVERAMRTVRDAIDKRLPRQPRAGRHSA